MAAVSRSQGGQEDALLDFVKDLRTHTKGRYLLHLNLSQLNREHKGPSSLMDAAACFHSLVSKGTGRLFRLSNKDMVFVSKQAAPLDVEAAAIAVQDLFRTDNLVRHDALVDWFDIHTDYEKVKAHCQSLVDDKHALKTTDFSADDNAQAPLKPSKLLYRPITAPKTAEPVSLSQGRPIRPADVDRLESNLRAHDLSQFLKTEHVAAIAKGSMEPHVVFESLVIDFDALRRKILPDCDFTSDPWLFERLQQSIERQLLKTLRPNHLGQAMASSIPLHIKAVLSDDFSAMAKQLKGKSDRPIIVEIRLLDMMAHAQLYVKARARLHELGYRVCLHGMDAFDFAHLSRRRIIADFEKIRWRDDYATSLMGDLRTLYQDASALAGRGRLILSGCHLAEAQGFGANLGISLFQGHHVEELLQNKSSRQSA